MNSSERVSLTDRNGGKALLAILLAGATVRAIIVALPTQFLLAHIVPDDAFYYLTIARHVAADGVFSFDGLAPTNGYHPLWQLLLVPLSLVHAPPDSAFRMMLVLQAILELGTIALLFRFATRLGASIVAALVAAAIYALSPIVLTQAGGMNGMETPLASLLLLLFLYYAFDGLGSVPGRLRPAPLSFAAALLVIARLDMAIPVVAVVGALVWRNRRDVTTLRRVIVAASVPALALGIVIALNVGMFGMPLPVSALSIGWMARDYLGSDAWNPLQWGFRLASNAVWTVRYAPFGLVAIRATIGVTAALLAVALIAGFRFRPDFPATRWARGSGTMMVALLIAWIVFIVAQTFRIPLLRSWYHGLWMIPATLIVVRLFDALRGPAAGDRIRFRQRVWIGVSLLLLALGAYNGLEKEGRDGTKLTIALRGAALLDPGTFVGSWNSGTIAFFAPSLRVVNLDGVVNNVAWSFIRERRLDSYRRAIGIEYLADDLGSFAVWSRYWTPEGVSIIAGTRRLTSEPIPGGQDTIVLVKLTDATRR